MIHQRRRRQKLGFSSAGGTAAPAGQTPVVVAAPGAGDGAVGGTPTAGSCWVGTAAPAPAAPAAPAWAGVQRIGVGADLADQIGTHGTVGAAIDRGRECVERLPCRGVVTVGRRPLGDQRAPRRVLKAGFVEILEVGAEGVGLGEDEAAVPWDRLGEWLDVHR